MISYVLPTHDRPDCLGRTIDALGRLPQPTGTSNRAGFPPDEVLVVDNAGTPAVVLPPALPNGLPVRVLRRETNEAAAGRNAGARAAGNDWLVMLDDDSWPMDDGHLAAIADADGDVAAIGAEIVLPDGRREAGGLPEVFVGCGVAIRREAFLQAGGYDPSFDYYAEEYDLSAKLLRSGWRVIHDRRFRVMHEKAKTGRDMNRILHHLVRNNGWVAQRYAPRKEKHRHLDQVIERYAQIAVKEHAAEGFTNGMRELLFTLDRQPDLTMDRDLWDRFTGVSHVRHELGQEQRLRPGVTAAVVGPGKNEWVVRQALDELGVTVVETEDEADVLVIGTLSPGPMLDAFDRLALQPRPVIMPWRPESARSETPLVC